MNFHVCLLWKVQNGFESLQIRFHSAVTAFSFFCSFLFQLGNSFVHRIKMPFSFSLTEAVCLSNLLRLKWPEKYNLGVSAIDLVIVPSNCFFSDHTTTKRDACDICLSTFLNGLASLFQR